jgi:hypothetical protein
MLARSEMCGLLRTWWIALLLRVATTACTNTSGAQQTSPLGPSVDRDVPESVRALLLPEAQRQSNGRPVTVADRTTILRENSRAIPNLVYYWGVHSPSGTAHVSRVSVVGVGEKGVKPIRSVADWHALAPEAWRIATDSAVVDACAEAVRLTQAERFPGLSYHIVRAPSGVPRIPVPEPQSLVTQVQPPVVLRTEAKVTAEFWLVQTGDVVRYRCQLDPAETRLQPLSTIKDAGFMRPN